MQCECYIPMLLYVCLNLQSGRRRSILFHCPTIASSRVEISNSILEHYAASSRCTRSMHRYLGEVDSPSDVGKYPENRLLGTLSKVLFALGCFEDDVDLSWPTLPFGGNVGTEETEF